MLNKLQAVANRYEELCAKSEQPDFYADPKKATTLLREKNELEPVVETYRQCLAAQQEKEEAQARKEARKKAKEAKYRQKMEEIRKKKK